MAKHHDPILVAYASRGGSTAGVAAEIGRRLTERGLAVEVLPMAEVGDIAGYRAVIAGSAIRRERWLPEGMDFMRRHQAELAGKPFAAFLVCLALAAREPRRRERARQTAAGWLEPVRSLAGPVSEGLFAGVLDVQAIPEPGWRLLGRLVAGLRIVPEGDHRDWAAIRGWADALPARLAQPTTGGLRRGLSARRPR
ncbi:MAG TPA: flavodoxin domain-containing protein [Herpetosiphonaceae bacterium]|nr:flavodoxin domain-containing protein [Herpetosiphonaceae bacterium]